MEKSVEWEFDTYMQEIFQMKEVDIKEYSPLTLAYIGDCIYDLIIKTLVINEGNRQVQKLHQKTSSYVQASAQSKMMRAMQEHLTEEEHAIYKKRPQCQECIAGEEPVDHRLQTCDGIRSPAWLSVSEKRVEKNAGTG